MEDDEILEKKETLNRMEVDEILEKKETSDGIEVDKILEKKETSDKMEDDEILEKKETSDKMEVDGILEKKEEIYKHYIKVDEKNYMYRSLEDIKKNKFPNVSLSASENFWFHEEVVLENYIAKLGIFRISANFQINGENITNLQIIDVINLSNSETYLPKAEIVILERTNLRVTLSPQNIKTLSIHDAVLPTNFEDNEIHLDYLKIVLSKKIEKLPKYKEIASNHRYGNDDRLISHKIMDSLVGINRVAIFTYINPAIFNFPELSIVVNFDPKKIEQLVKGGFKLIIIKEGSEKLPMTQDLLIQIAEKYEIKTDHRWYRLIKKDMFNSEIYYQIPATTVLIDDIMQTVMNMMISEKIGKNFESSHAEKDKTRKKIWLISRLLVKNIAKVFPNLVFEEDLRKIDIIASERIIRTVDSQKNAVHARSLTIDKGMTVHQILASRITSLQIASWCKFWGKETLNFPNLNRLLVDLIQSDTTPNITFDRHKLRYLRYYPTFRELPFLAMNEDSIDLGYFPNLEKFVTNRSIVDKIINPNKVTIKLCYSSLRYLGDENRETPLIVMHLTECLPDLTKYNIKKIYIARERSSDYLGVLAKMGYKGVIKLHIPYDVRYSVRDAGKLINIKDYKSIVRGEKYYKFS